MSLPASLRLSKSTVDALTPQAKEYVAWDTSLIGFGVRIYPSGIKTYIVHARAQGVQHKRTIGRHGVRTTDQARAEARQILASWERGVVEPRHPEPGPTFADLAGRYLAEHAVKKKKASSVRPDRYNLRLHLLPRWKNRPLAQLTVNDVLTVHGALWETPGAANRCVSLLSKMFALARRWGWYSGENPARGIERYPEQKPQRLLSATERARLLAAIDQLAGAQLARASALAAIRFLLFTGMRPAEVFTLSWEMIDWEHRLLVLPDSKTGQTVRYLGEEALAILQGRPQDGRWVFPGRHGKGPLVNVHKLWYRLRTLAELPGDLRLYDLRHTFASVAAEEGYSLPMIGALLGHTHPATTARYVHLVNAPVHEAARRVGKAVRGEETTAPAPS